MSPSTSKPLVHPFARVAILVVALAVAIGLSVVLTGAALPQDVRQASLFQNTLLLVIIGSAILEHHFTKPADSLVNAVVGLVTLLTVYNFAPLTLWWIICAYVVLVLVLALVCVAVSSGSEIAGLARSIADFSYRPAVVLGQGRVLFSVLFFFSLFSFYSLQSPVTVSLVIFWALYMSLWPLGVPQLLSGWLRRTNLSRPLGTLLRTDDPGVLRFALEPSAVWEVGVPVVHASATGNQHWVLPLFSQLQADRLIGTALRLGDVDEPITGLTHGCVYQALPDTRPSEPDVMAALGEPASATLVGTVMEKSSISAIRFEVLRQSGMAEGTLVWCKVGEERVYYQVTEGITAEEVLDSDRHGYRVAVAVQLGILDSERGFRRYQWLPAMNAPVFASADPPSSPASSHPSDFMYGHIPNSEIAVTGPFIENYNFHTAILGVTGSGKTELGFDLMRHAVRAGIKVVCIDLTQQYESRLDDLGPVDLGISDEVAAKLSEKLFGVETGAYGAGKEKVELQKFAAPLRQSVAESVDGFLSGDTEAPGLGLIQLEDISNTQASLFITELYMTSILNWAREARQKPKVLVVVEEAHTVMPEASTMGLGDFGSRGLVGKIAQVALQGRKYGVGLLVLAQRTATVSKTVLTQCNTIVSFATYDPTSIEFLGNVVGEPMARALPTLKPLQALVFGKAVRSDQPVIVEIPFDEAKAEISS